MQIVLADLTRANIGSIQHVLGAALRNAPPGTSFLVLIFEHQEQELLNFGFDGRVEKISIANSVSQKCSELISQELQGNVSRVVVASFHGEVLRLASQFEGDSRLCFSPWKTVSAAISGNPAPVASKERPWPANAIPEDESLAALTRALQHFACTSQDSARRQTDIRSLLSAIDPKFDKRNPMASQPGFIATLISRAKAKNLAGC